jgi:hypothetical protein
MCTLANYFADFLARYLAILGELFGNFQPRKLFELGILPNKEPNFAKDFAKVQAGNSKLL